MATIKQVFIIDNNGQQYRAALSYQKDGRPRGYYVSVNPCTVEDTGHGFLSVTTSLYDPDAVFTCVEQIKRASDSARGRAASKFDDVLEIYFAPRGILYQGSAAGLLEWTAQNGR